MENDIKVTFSPEALKVLKNTLVKIPTSEKFESFRKLAWDKQMELFSRLDWDDCKTLMSLCTPQFLEKFIKKTKLPIYLDIRQWFIEEKILKE